MFNKADIKNIDSALNGLEGFNLVKIKSYDLIICDINMPVMDGYECAQQIRNLYSPNNQLFEQNNKSD